MATTTFKKHENNATSTLNTGINSSIKTVVLASGGGAEFPSSGAFWVTVFDTNVDTANEVMLIDSRSSDTLTVNASGRGDQGTTAVGWTAGAQVQQLWTKEDITDITGAINNIEDGTTNVSSVSTAGDITVGTDGTGNMITGTGNTTLAVFNTIATTVNAFGAASTAINIGHVSGTNTILGASTFSQDASFTGDVTIDGFFNVGVVGDSLVLSANTSGVVTALRTNHKVDTYDTQSTGDLITISGGVEGDILILNPNHNDRDVVLKDGGGNLRLAGDFTMNHKQDQITLKNNGTNWIELARSSNA